MRKWTGAYFCYLLCYWVVFICEMGGIAVKKEGVYLHGKGRCQFSLQLRRGRFKLKFQWQQVFFLFFCYFFVVVFKLNLRYCIWFLVFKEILLFLFALLICRLEKFPENGANSSRFQGLNSQSYCLNLMNRFILWCAYFFIIFQQNRNSVATAN